MTATADRVPESIEEVDVVIAGARLAGTATAVPLSTHAMVPSATTSTYRWGNRETRPVATTELERAVLSGCHRLLDGFRSTRPAWTENPGWIVGNAPAPQSHRPAAIRTRGQLSADLTADSSTALNP